MAESILFKKAVEGTVSSSIPIELEKADEYAVGKVLIYSKKPRKVIPMWKHELEFTGHSLQSLLAEGQQELVITTTKYCKDCSSTKVEVDIEADDKIMKFLPQVAPVDAAFSGKLEIESDFGKITHMTTDLVDTITRKKIQVKTDHPIMKKAIEHGGAILVITTIYEAEHCHLSIRLSPDDTSQTAKVSHKVFTRDQPIPIGYMVLKLSVNSKGFLKTKLNTRLSHKLESCLSLKASSYQKSDPYEGWVIVEILSQEERKGGMPDFTAEFVESLQMQDKKDPPCEIGSVKQIITSDNMGQGSSSEISYPHSSLSSESHPATTAATSVAKPQSTPNKSNDTDDTDDGMPNEYYLYSLKDFQPFQSSTYSGILDESKKWVEPLLSNNKLQDALLTYTKPPRTYERLNDLSDYFLEVGNAMRSNQPIPRNVLKDVEPIIDALNKEDSETRLDEITSVIVVAEAADEFPQHIVQKIIELPDDKRKLLMDVILSTPYGVYRHAYIDEGPFKDSSLYPIMSRMGFSIPSGTKNLLHTRRDSEEEEDMLAAALILLLGSEKK